MCHCRDRNAILSVVFYSVVIIPCRTYWGASQACSLWRRRCHLENTGEMRAVDTNTELISRILLQLSKQVFADILIIQPFMFWPTYYTFKEFCFSPPSDTRKPGAIVVDALQKARMHSFADNVGMGAFWIPANYYIYALPMYLRLPVNHGVSFLWCCILSLWRGSKESAIANETVG
eukprot:m.1454979 g.1454979  ORF g.1454979 m.1454979 type:complete len:176 (-) comp25119_c0_seq37:2393-2920(-)